MEANRDDELKDGHPKEAQWIASVAIDELGLSGKISRRSGARIVNNIRRVLGSCPDIAEVDRVARILSIRRNTHSYALLNQCFDRVLRLDKQQNQKLQESFRYHVVLVRYVGHANESWKGGLFYKRMSLPIPPFIGLGITVDSGGDPEKVEHVYINELGTVLVLLKPIKGDRITYEIEDEWTKQLEYHTQGWTQSGRDTSECRMPLI